MTTEEIEARLRKLERGVRRWRIAAVLFVAVLVVAFLGPLPEWAYWNWVKPQMEVDYLDVRGIHLEENNGVLDGAGLSFESARGGAVDMNTAGMRVNATYPDEYRFPLGMFPGHPASPACTYDAAYLGQGKHGGALTIRSWLHPVVHAGGDKNGHGVLRIGGADGKTATATH